MYRSMSLTPGTAGKEGPMIVYHTIIESATWLVTLFG
jgi:hypothetical protein